MGVEAGELIGPPKPQRRWSKTLVRHGAEARTAISVVLRLSARDLVVRDRP
jgi:hypothetical protein